MIECDFVFVGIAECGCIMAICIPGMAKEVGEMVIGGMKVEKRPAPQSLAKNPECPLHNKPKGLAA